ncbi:MAG: site-specific DNA-methyltransferase [Methanobacteriota archaeon]|nr:MAG: site-specific DNA-methyltransferase [Euryarchaeota archaeon]
MQTLKSQDLLTIKDASRWASEFTGRQVSPANISYLIQYGLVEKFTDGGVTLVSKSDLIRYYSQNSNAKEHEWKRKLGTDLNWALSFDGVKESERTKHVHRLHPYKGKFIPQLVEYFLDDHLDDFKREVYFHPGDIVLDPFGGSGTTLVQANELGMHAIGVDVSLYNVMISNVKVGTHDLESLNAAIREITRYFRHFLRDSRHETFERALKGALSEFNKEFFPSPAFKRRVRKGEIDQYKYGKIKLQEFLPLFRQIAAKYEISTSIKQEGSFLERWYLPSTREDLLFLRDRILEVGDPDIQKILFIILGRTARSCRATTHSDLATLIKPVTSPYYCRKHGKICAPLFSASKWWNYYSKDTLKRLWQFQHIRTSTIQQCIVGDSRTIELERVLREENPSLAELVQAQGIKGIFTSPPYVGMINYHEQHEYAYELFGLDRRDDLEIGPLYKGQGETARREYVESIAQVLKNMQNYLVDDFEIFIVANDKFGLYPTIAKMVGLRIVQEFKRPVLNRTEKNKTPYAESIFRMKRR